MASSSETLEPSPSYEDSPPTSLGSEQRPDPNIREWTQFELDTVCALICKHEHQATWKEKLQMRARRRKMGSDDPDGCAKDWAVLFARKLNEVLYGIYGHKRDIPADDIRELMDFIETKNASVMKYIKRQSAPFRITRSKRYAFQRLCHDFNDEFYRWTIIRRERLRNPDVSDAEISRLHDWVDDFLDQKKGTYLLEAAPIQEKEKNTESSAASGRGWNTNSGYGRRNQEALNTFTSASKAQSSRNRTRRAKPALPSHRQNKRRTAALLPPPPPPPPFQYGEMSGQPFDLYNTARYGVPGPEPSHYGHPTSSPWYFPPASPAFFGHEDLRQSIHPMGPMPDTPMTVASPAYQYYPEPHQGAYEMDQQPNYSVFSALPMNIGSYAPGFQYPEPPQNSEVDYSTFLDTPMSPLSPMYMPGITAADLAEMQMGVADTVIQETHYTNNDLYPQFPQSY
ncbi:hypothetical protein F5Y10DRAFT_262018 [Nemania abortiva]|nr:hypothetical protein F5Y10DRAFT_262018 [Nemania abortiva]